MQFRFSKVIGVVHKGCSLIFKEFMISVQVGIIEGLSEFKLDGKSMKISKNQLGGFTFSSV